MTCTNQFPCLYVGELTENSTLKSYRFFFKCSANAKRTNKCEERKNDIGNQFRIKRHCAFEWVRRNWESYVANTHCCWWVFFLISSTVSFCVCVCFQGHCPYIFYPYIGILPRNASRKRIEINKKRRNSRFNCETCALLGECNKLTAICYVARTVRCSSRQHLFYFHRQISATSSCFNALNGIGNETWPRLLCMCVCWFLLLFFEIEGGNVK